LFSLPHVVVVQMGNSNSWQGTHFIYFKNLLKSHM
jgi:hypothetical protein